MAWWITVYCKKSVAKVTAAELQRALTGPDLDYLTLAEAYGVDEALVAPAVKALRVVANSGGPLDIVVRYRGDDTVRPIMLHHWADSLRVNEELHEARQSRLAPDAALPHLDDTKEIVAIELGFSMLDDMGIAFAYELARYLGDVGAGLIVDDEGDWRRVEGRVFKPV